MVVDELLKSPYRNIDAKNQEGRTAVHLACNLSDDKILQRLIDSKANVNCRDSDGNAPLHVNMILFKFNFYSKFFFL